MQPACNPRKQAGTKSDLPHQSSRPAKQTPQWLVFSSLLYTTETEPRIKRDSVSRTNADHCFSVDARMAEILAMRATFLFRRTSVINLANIHTMNAINSVQWLLLAEKEPVEPGGWHQVKCLQYPVHSQDIDRLIETARSQLSDYDFRWDAGELYVRRKQMTETSAATPEEKQETKPPVRVQVGQIVRCVKGSADLLRHGDRYQIVVVVHSADCHNGKQSGVIVKKVYADYQGQTAYQGEAYRAYCCPIVWDVDRFEWQGEWGRSYPNQSANAEYMKELEEEQKRKRESEDTKVDIPVLPCCD